MNLEEELQQGAEDGKRFNTEKENLNARAYADVFEALQNIPGYTVPSNFADNVMEKIVAKQRQRVSIFSNDYFWLGTGLILLMTMAIAAVMLTNSKIDMGFLNTMSAYKGLLIFGVTFIVILNMLDKRLIRKRS